MAVLPGRAVGSWGHREQGLVRSEPPSPPPAPGEGCWASLPAAAVGSQVAHPALATGWGLRCQLPPGGGSPAQKSKRPDAGRPHRLLQPLWAWVQAVGQPAGRGRVGRAGLEGPRQLSGDVRQDQSQEHRGHFRSDHARGPEAVTCRTKGASRPRSPSGRPPWPSGALGPVSSTRGQPSHFTTTPEGPAGRAGTRPSPGPPGAARTRCLHPPPGPGSADEGGRLGRPQRWGCTPRAALLQRTRCVCEARGRKLELGETPLQTPCPPRPSRRVSSGSSASLPRAPPLCPGRPPALGSLRRTPPPSVAGGKGWERIYKIPSTVR